MAAMRTAHACMLTTLLFSLLLLPALGAGQSPPGAVEAAAENDPWWEGDSRYPNLGTGEVGELPEEAEQEQRTWDRALPFLAQDVIDLGFDLPNPYGIGAVLARVEQEILISNLSVGLGGGELRPVDFLEFGKSEVDNSTGQIKLDAWVLPFMNVYAILGRLDGDGIIPMSAPGDEILKFLLPAVGELCDRQPGFPGRPDICDETLSGTALPKYEGNNVGVGVTLAMGWRQYFVAVPITYVYTDLDIVDSRIEVVQAAPRLGFTIDRGDDEMVAFFVGGSWIDVELDLTGSVVLAPEGGGDAVTIDYRLTQENKDAWNYVAGFNWDIKREWSVMTEVGFGGSRKHLIGSVVYRW